MSTVAQDTVRKALNDFRIANCAPLNGTGIDATNEILPEIYSLATLLDMGFRKPDFDGKEDAALENANPELVACAFNGIARLAALAMFASDHRKR